MSYYGRGYAWPSRRATRKNRVRFAQPNQSLSIQEMVTRFMRNIPVTVSRREPVYNDQAEHDLEKVSRMDFADKHEFAAQQAERAAELQRSLDEQKRSRAERLAKKAEKEAEEAAKRAAKNTGGHSGAPGGIGSA